MAVALSFLALAGAVAWDHHHHHHYYPPTPSHHHHDWTPSPHSPPGPSRESAQVHIALGKTKSELNVAWRATDESKESSVEYGTDCSNLDKKVSGDSRKFTQDYGRTWYTRTATLTGLEVDTKYCYRVSDSEETFETLHRRQGAPYKHLLYADMGAKGAHAICDACTVDSESCDKDVCAKAQNPNAGLISEVATADLIFHGGDFAYDMGDYKGDIGDAFMANIEQLAAHVPYMVSHGNHEVKRTNLPHYIERFRNMPSNADVPTFHTVNGDGATNSMYYSFDHGMVHYVIFTSELWHHLAGMDRNVTIDKMVAWLKADLAEANKHRDEYPWILVSGHRAFYTSMEKGASCYPTDKPMREALEDILFDAGVDIVMNGHVHNYERAWPVYKEKATYSTTDMNAPMYVVSGAGGCHETASAFEAPEPHWSAFRSNTYGYSRMTVHNATHLHWEQVSTDPLAFPMSEYGKVIDDVWLVQHNHGPFKRTSAPQGTACPAGLAKTHDRFTPEYLGIAGQVDVPRDAPTWQHVAAFKEQYGEAAYEAVKAAALGKLNNATGAAGLYQWYTPPQ
eukprot:TRINITY_DN332_c0_g1_i1.p1 TRINITY_DN332_c0_g1~~TRINITY_DN332_c0_g1_i1.p1  ORF type:complete len:566 (+),score=276.77 TRINITY_DN332_c0_g1_i1:63-1760(+)